MQYFHVNFLNCNNYTTHIRTELNTVTDYCDLEKYSFNIYNGKEKEQTTIYKTLHRKLKIEQHEHHQAKHRGWTQVIRKDKQFLIRCWHSSCYSSYKPDDKSWMRKGSPYLDSGLLLTMKLLNQWFLLAELNSSLRKFHGRHHDFGWPLWNICVTNDYGYTPFVVRTSFPHSWYNGGSFGNINLVRSATFYWGVLARHEHELSFIYVFRVTIPPLLLRIFHYNLNLWHDLFLGVLTFPL
jgi:hypothetical protein